MSTSGGSRTALAGRDAVVREAAAVLLRGERLDTSVLAASLGMSRATLFRRIGNREVILAEALWYLTERTLRRAESAADAREAAGDSGERLRCLAVMEDFRRAVAGSTAVRTLLTDEPVLALRLLTDPRGRVQPRLVEHYTALLQRDVDGRRLRPLVALPLLAFAVVRLGESFLYADALASGEVDLDTATTVLDAFVTSVLTPDRGRASDGH